MNYIGSRVKILKSDLRHGSCAGKTGLIVRQDGDWKGKQAFLVNMGDGKCGWFLAHELEFEVVK